MSLSVLNVRLYLVRLRDRKWRSELSKTGALVGNVKADSGSLGTFFYSIHAFSFHFCHRRQCSRRTWKSRPSRCALNVTCHACCLSAIFRECVSTVKVTAVDLIRGSVPAAAHLFALHIKDNPKAEYSITLCVGRCAHLSCFAATVLSCRKGFFIFETINKPVLVKHSFILLCADVTSFACFCTMLTLFMTFVWMEISH